MPWIKNPPLLPCMAVAAFLIALVYSPVQQFGFIWDDLGLFVDTAVYRNQDAWHYALTQPFLISPNYYRPLATLSFVAEGRLHGMDPGWMHITGLMLHITNALLVGLLISALTRTLTPGFSNWASILGMLAYGLHYGLMELPAWISCRFDLLCTLGLLLTLLADVRIRSHWLAGTLMGLGFLIAATSKETAAVLALVLPCWHMMRATLEGATSRSLWLLKQWPRYIALAAVGLGFLLARSYIIDAATAEFVLPDTASWVPWWALDIYLRLLVIPFAYISPIYPEALPHWQWMPLLTIAFILLPCWVYRKTAQGKAIAWLALAMLAALLPILHVVKFSLFGSFAASRYLAFPGALFVIFIALAASILVTQHERAIRPVFALLALWLLASVINIGMSLPLWENPLQLWSWARAKYPSSAYAANNQISELMRYYSGEFAENILDEALEEFPDNINIRLHSSARFLSKNQTEHARKELDQLHDKTLSRQQAGIYLSQQTILAIQECAQPEAILEMSQNALAINPQLTSSWLFLALAYAINQDKDAFSGARQRMLSNAGDKQARHYDKLLSLWIHKAYARCPSFMPVTPAEKSNPH